MGMGKREFSFTVGGMKADNIASKISIENHQKAKKIIHLMTQLYCPWLMPKGLDILLNRYLLSHVQSCSINNS